MDFVSTPENPNGDIKPEDIGKYTNLHAHSIYSPLDGFGKLEEYCERVKALGMKGLCLSEHGNMIGHHEQAKICAKHGIKPIFANEGYMTLHAGSIKEKIEGYKANYHILLIAINEQGYRNLMKATSIAWTRYKYYKPRFDLALLEECNEGLICTSACLGGPINQLYLDGRPEEAEQVALKLKEIFGDRFYLEKTYTGLEEQDIANKNLVEISKKHNIPMIITCDSHYVYPWQSDSHAKLVMVNTGGQINKAIKAAGLTDSSKEDADVDSNSMFYQPSQYYVKPHHVLVEEYYSNPEDEEAFANTNKIADMCNVVLPKNEDIIFPSPYSDPDSVLRGRAMQWYSEYSKKLSDEQKALYLDRLEEELDMYSKMGFSSYPLVLQEILDEAKAKGIMIGPGRGCLFEGTKVLINRSGSIYYCPIEFVKVGDMVWTHNSRWKSVYHTTKYVVDYRDMVTLETEYGMMHLTEDHKVKTKNHGFIPAIELDGQIHTLDRGTLSDEILSKVEDYKTDSIENFELSSFYNEDEPVRVYDLMVDEDCSFRTNICMVHNSAAGSLLSYALGITAIDPIPYGLMFSRYLNAGRAKLPVIEIKGYPLKEWLTTERK
jgi:DNA polymerase III alpha subunit|nr:MAG TPA: hypothetical protein [Bacteriophage sp.]